MNSRSFQRFTNVRVLCYSFRMTEHAQSKSLKNAKVCGISFQPHIFEQLEAEASRMDRPNRSLVVERALERYFAKQGELREKVAEVMAAMEGVA